MDDKILKTTIDFLIEHKYNEVASLIVEAKLTIHYPNNHHLDCILIDLPLSSYSILNDNQKYQEIISKAVNKVCIGQFYDVDGSIMVTDIPVVFRTLLSDVDDDWRDKVKKLIISFKERNQGVITEKIFRRENKNVIPYNEMKFGSKAEVRIAQELEKKGVLFFPLPLAIKHDETKKNWENHREPDFLICLDGAWGILEVSFHKNRYEKDSEKSSWFKKAGVLCIEHYTSERCFNHTKEVVEEFLEVLKKYKRY